MFPKVHIAASGGNRCSWIRFGVDIEVTGVRARPGTSPAPVLVHSAIFAPLMKGESSFHEGITCLPWSSSKAEETGCGLVRFHLAVCEREQEQELRHIAAALNNRIVALNLVGTCQIDVFVKEYSGCRRSAIRKLNSTAGHIRCVRACSSGKFQVITRFNACFFVVVEFIA